MFKGALFESAIAALLFSGTFLAGAYLHPLRILVRDQRRAISFGAGMSTAYVFVRVMPELSEARKTLMELPRGILPFEGMAIYFVALAGFVLFYGLDHLRRQLQDTKSEADAKLSFRVHIGGFAAYVGLAAYLLINGNQKSLDSIWLYTVALTFHFLAVDHSLREEYGLAYERRGRFVLAGMSVLGWAAGALVAVPNSVTALGLAFLSGGIIVNASIMELPSGKDGSFPWFAAGGAFYGLILIPLG